MRRWRHRAAEIRGAVPDSPKQRSSPWAFGDEFDAFLAGAYVEWLAAKGRATPTWAWVNCIAHGTVDELQALSSAGAPADLRDDASLWQVLTGFLAKEVLARVTDEAQLEALQRDVLVPLELRLAERWWSSFAPIDVASAVLAALPESRGVG